MRSRTNLLRQKQYKHMTFYEAGRSLAKKAEVKQMWLTHFSVFGRRKKDGF